MQFSEWEPIYEMILSDFGYDRSDDEMSVRVLKASTMNSDIISEDVLHDIVGKEVSVIGDSPDLEKDLEDGPPTGTIIVSGSAVARVISCGYAPDIIVTDLDGDIAPQMDACNSGIPTLIHAHGDNPELIIRYVPEFRGPIILTTQSRPDNTVLNFGGFTDGDRAVCMAEHFGAETIMLKGFDFENPNPKAGSDPETKKRKLAWAKRIIFDSLGGNTRAEIR